MQNKSMCRICLASDVRLCSIASHLRDMFERITAVTFQREDNSPLVACYICHARLQNCYRLRTSYLRSEELLNEMMSSDVFKPQNVLSTNTLSVVPVLHFSLVRAPQDSTKCHIKDEASEVICDAELDQLLTEDIVTEAEEEPYAQIDDSHLDNVINWETDDVETDDEDIKLEIEDTILEETDPNVAGPCPQLAENICPKVVKIVLESIDVNDTTADIVTEAQKEQCAQIDDSHLDNVINWEADDVETDDEDSKLEIEDTILQETDPSVAGPCPQLAENICPKVVKILLKRIDVNYTTTALKDTEDAITNKRNKEVGKNEETENLTIKEPKIVTNKTSVEKPVATRKIVKTCDKLHIKLNKCENVVTSIVNNVCEEKSTNNTSLKHNVSRLSISKNKQYSCDTCKKCFGNISHLKTHILTHTDEKPYTCNDCKKCFTQKIHLIRHIRIHTGEKPYECNVCAKCFSEKGSLNRHIRTHTGEKPHRCTICKKCFSRKNVLNIHIRSHAGEKPHKCNVCKKSFFRKSYLIKHIRTHTGEKPYECTVCAKCFNDKGNLQIHIRTHTGEKPYRCTVCKKCFAYKNMLKTHIRTHTGEKPYKCHVCKKDFTRSCYLLSHIRTHTGEKPYECHVCKKCFTQKSHLRIHIRKHFIF